VSVELPRRLLPHGLEASTVQECGVTRLAARILLVEDSPDTQRLVCHVLSGVGAEVEIAANGLEALERATSARAADASHDIILLDMQMPVMDGEAAARELRRQGFESPILAFTAESGDEARRRVLLAGCDDLVSKPIDRRELLTTIERLLRAKDRG
jgi:CheY-like chemotaxis protein